MRKLILLVATALMPVLATAAPASEESVLALFSLMKTEALLDGMYASIEVAMKQGMAQSLAGKPLNDEQRRIIDLAPQRLGAVLRAELSWEKIQPLQVAIYRDSFEQSEIDGLIAFYGSPAGQAYVNKLPAVTQRAMASMQVYTQSISPKLKAAMDQVMREAKLVAQ